MRARQFKVEKPRHKRALRIRRVRQVSYENGIKTAGKSNINTAIKAQDRKCVCALEMST